MYKITLPIRFGGMRYGIEFTIDHLSNRGIGYSDNEYMVKRLAEKGFKVEKDGEEMALSQLNREKARQKTIEKAKQQKLEIKDFEDEFKQSDFEDLQETPVNETELTTAEQQILEERKTTRKKK